MNLVNYLQFLEPVQEHFTKVYSTASVVITVLVVLWCLNFIAGLIQRTYMTGRAFGHFYRHYLHKHIKGSVVKCVSLFRREETTSLQSEGEACSARSVS